MQKFLYDCSEDAQFWEAFEGPQVSADIGQGDICASLDAIENTLADIELSLGSISDGMIILVDSVDALKKPRSLQVSGKEAKKILEEREARDVQEGKMIKIRQQETISRSWNDKLLALEKEQLDEDNALKTAVERMEEEEQAESLKRDREEELAQLRQRVDFLSERLFTKTALSKKRVRMDDAGEALSVVDNSAQ